MTIIMNDKFKLKWRGIGMYEPNIHLEGEREVW
jgi:hypothetical protein